jgi:siroheme decarboxylase
VNEIFSVVDIVDRELLQWLQNEFPITKRPWKAGAKALAIPEKEILTRVQRLSTEGVIRNLRTFVNAQRLGFGSSTLVAMMVPEEDIDRIVPIINEYPQVTHNYRREHAFNIWFTITARNEPELQRTFEEIKRRTGVLDPDILDLHTIRVYKVDVRFQFTKEGGFTYKSQEQAIQGFPLMDKIDHTLIRITQEGIPLVRDPFLVIANGSAICQDEVIQRLQYLYKMGIIKRIGISVNQRKLGILANALVAWKIPPGSTEVAGKKLASSHEVTHCYERRIFVGKWEYNFFTVLHGYNHESVENLVQKLSDDLGIRDYVILFSTEQFKRTSIIHQVPEYSTCISIREA